MFREERVGRGDRLRAVRVLRSRRHFDYRTVRRREGPIWKLVTEKPVHLLDPRVSTTGTRCCSPRSIASIARAKRDGRAICRDARGRDPTSPPTGIRCRAATAVRRRWLDMPLQPLTGDLYTPSMHWGSNAPSERMIVSPGREADGIMHMPTGQSGHPLSPFYVELARRLGQRRADAVPAGRRRSTR